MKNVFTKLQKNMTGLMEKIESGHFSAKEILLSGVVLFLIGFIAGIFASPKQMFMGCYNGSNFGDTLNGIEEKEEIEE